MTDMNSTPKITCNMTISLDGFTSGPDLLDEGAWRIMDWIHQATVWRARSGLEGGDTVDSEAMAAFFENTGAFVMGRTMFEHGEKPWGDNPVFHAPVFVVTHRSRDPLVKDGGTTFTFVTDGLVRTVELAREAAGGRMVQISGGPNTVRQAVDANLIDELRLHIAPVLLGTGRPLFGTLSGGRRELELVKVRQSRRAVHLTYRFLRDAPRS
jgi:dihydrofolate reductase